MPKTDTTAQCLQRINIAQRNMHWGVNPLRKAGYTHDKMTAALAVSVLADYMEALQSELAGASLRARKTQEELDRLTGVFKGGSAFLQELQKRAAKS